MKSNAACKRRTKRAKSGQRNASKCKMTVGKSKNQISFYETRFHKIVRPGFKKKTRSHVNRGALDIASAAGGV
jgi:hypothetical protein